MTLTCYQAAQTDNYSLQVTDSGLKNEMLFTEFNTNYNDEPEMYKKGTVVYKEKVNNHPKQCCPVYQCNESV